MRFKIKRFLGLVLSLMLVMGLMPGMSFTALAYDNDPYASLVGTTTAVKFNGIDWYIIADDSTAANAGTVTLLAKDPIGISIFHGESNAYSSSTVKTYLDNLTATGGSFAGVAGAIASTDLTDVGVTGAKLYLLSTSEANELKENVLECSTTYGNCWWLRSAGRGDSDAACVFGEDGYYVDSNGIDVYHEFGVRPALKLNLSSVTFSSESKSFAPKVDITGVYLDKTTVSLTVGGTETLTATVSPKDSTNQTVTWASSDTSVATVSDAGVVTAVAAGFAIIAATATNGTDSDTSDDKTTTCEVTVNEVAAHTHNDITFTAWTSTNSLPTDAGSYYLTGNVELSERWSARGGVFNLCLNSYSIKGPTDFGAVFDISENATLNLYDCGEKTRTVRMGSAIQKLTVII